MEESLTPTASRWSLSVRLSLYRDLIKFKVLNLVVMMAFLGYLLGQPINQPVVISHFLATLLGVFFLGAGSSVLNQLQERSIDQKMPRTASRPYASGRIGLAEGIVVMGLCFSLGVTILGSLNEETLWLGLLTVLTYNGFYTLWWKRKWAFAAVPGAVPGALPILMGYSASNSDWTSPQGLYGFLILFFWQMPHFWSLAIRYREDYRKGGIPTLPVVYGVSKTLFHITLWTLAFVAVAILGQLLLHASPIYLMIVLPASFKLIWELQRFVRQPDEKGWLPFFLWINFSLLIYLAAALVDRWSLFLR